MDFCKVRRQAGQHFRATLACCKTLAQQLAGKLSIATLVCEGYLTLQLTNSNSIRLAPLGIHFNLLSSTAMSAWLASMCVTQCNNHQMFISCSSTSLFDWHHVRISCIHTIVVSVHYTKALPCCSCGSRGGVEDLHPSVYPIPLDLPDAVGDVLAHHLPAGYHHDMAPGHSASQKRQKSCQGEHLSCVLLLQYNAD